MEKVILEICRPQALQLLVDLEALELIKMFPLKKEVKSLSKKYGGQLSSEVAEKLNQYVLKGRSEWNNDTI